MNRTKTLFGFHPFRSSIYSFFGLNLWIILIINLLLALLYYYWWPWNLYRGHIWVHPLLNWLGSLSTFEFCYHTIGLLFLIPIVFGAIVFWWRGTIIALVFALSALLPTLIKVWYLSLSLVTNICIFLTPTIIFLLVCLEFEWHIKERKELIQREKERQIYMAQLIDAQENERRRVANDLHDGTIQNLAVVAGRLETIVSDVDEKEIMRIKNIIAQTIEELRRVIRDLRPPSLDNMGLIPSLRLLTSQANQESGIDMRFITLGDERKITVNAELSIFRILQEALNNIRWHSRASMATISIEFLPSKVVLTVEDDGQGFDVSETLSNAVSQNKFGLVSIKERVKIFGGSIFIKSEPGQGTSLVVEILGA